MASPENEERGTDTLRRSRRQRKFSVKIREDSEILEKLPGLARNASLPPSVDGDYPSQAASASQEIMDFDDSGDRDDSDLQQSTTPPSNIHDPWSAGQMLTPESVGSPSSLALMNVLASEGLNIRDFESPTSLDIALEQAGFGPDMDADSVAAPLLPLPGREHPIAPSTPSNQEIQNRGDFEQDQTPGSHVSEITTDSVTIATPPQAPARRKRGRPRKTVPQSQITNININHMDLNAPSTSRVTRRSSNTNSNMDKCDLPYTFVLDAEDSVAKNTRSRKSLQQTSGGLRPPTKAEQDARYAWVTENIKNSRPAAFPTIPVGEVYQEPEKEIADEEGEDQQDDGAMALDVSDDNQDDTSQHEQCSINQDQEIQFPVGFDGDRKRIKVLLQQVGFDLYTDPNKAIERVIVSTHDNGAPAFIDFDEDDLGMDPQVDGWITHPQTGPTHHDVYPGEFLEQHGLPRFSRLDIRIQVEMAENMMYLGEWVPIDFELGLKMRKCEMGALAQHMKLINAREKAEGLVGLIAGRRLREPGQVKNYGELYDEELAKVEAKFKKTMTERGVIGSLDEDWADIGMAKRYQALEFVRAWQLSRNYLGTTMPGEGSGVQTSEFRDHFIAKWAEDNTPPDVATLLASKQQPGTSRPSLPIRQARLRAIHKDEPLQSVEHGRGTGGSGTRGGRSARQERDEEMSNKGKAPEKFVASQNISRIQEKMLSQDPAKLMPPPPLPSRSQVGGGNGEEGGGSSETPSRNMVDVLAAEDEDIAAAEKAPAASSFRGGRGKRAAKGKKKHTKKRH